MTTSTVIDGVTHTTKETKGKADQTLSIAYSPAALNVGTASSSWTYNDANKLLSVPGYISSVTYMAESQTKVISYSNGVTSTFAYSSQRSWITRVTTAKGTTVLMDNQYVRDTLGRIKTITVVPPAKSWTYGYDDLSRLAGTVSQTGQRLRENHLHPKRGSASQVSDSSRRIARA